MPPDPAEPERLARAAAEVGLTHVVITAVARDDLRDGGADHFARCVEAVREFSPQTTVEVLTSDLKGDEASIRRIAECDLHIFNHNLETVARLQKRVRPQARYDRSLDVLRRVKAMRGDVLTKSGLMLGLGETDAEVEETLTAMRDADIDIVTIGQYMQPLGDNLDVEDYSTLDRFAHFREVGDALGFLMTLSGPYVRSSFGAAEAARALGVLRDGKTDQPKPQMHG